jgi:hypothetical protein
MNTKRHSKIFDSETISNILNDYYSGYNNGIRNIFYRNMIGYRKANLKFLYTYEELLEYGKCANDICYFIETYCEVFTALGLQKIKLYDFQKNLIKDSVTNRFNITLSSRQTGMSMIIYLLMLHNAIFNVNNTIILFDNKLANGIEMMDKLKVVYQKLPFFLKPGIKSFDKSSICFDNGSQVRMLTPNSAIGFSINKLYINDFAYMSLNHKKNFMMQIYPVLSKRNDSQVFIASGYNGFEFFYQLYDNALRFRNNFCAHKINWWDVPDRDDIWKKETINCLGSYEKFQQEYEMILSIKKPHHL